MSMQLAFIHDIAPAAIAFRIKYGISAALTIAQACLETGYGAFAPGNNMFGIKADPSWKGPVTIQHTWEEIQGQKVVVLARFRAYKTLGDSLTDHALFLVQNERYHNLIDADYKTSCEEIAKVDGYATDPEYGQKLLEIINQFQLWKFDDMAYNEKYKIFEVKVDKHKVYAIMVSNVVYPIWGALRIFNTPYKLLGGGVIRIGNEDVKGVIFQGRTYIPWNKLAPNVKSEKVNNEWVFSLKN